MIHQAITEDIIGAAMAVLNDLKPGLDEKLYENALLIELRARGHLIEQQRDFPVHYRGQLVGRLTPDLIVDGKVIADPKVVSAFNDTHLAQMIGCLNITGLEVALLLNFKNARLEWKRIIREKSGNTPPTSPSAKSAVKIGSLTRIIYERDLFGLKARRRLPIHGLVRELAHLAEPPIRVLGVPFALCRARTAVGGGQT